MRKILTIGLVLSGFACNPYQPYDFTHYHITAAYDPGTSHLSANVRLVLVPAQEYHDSITLALNEHMEIQSLAAQELKYYTFESGRLVLYIEGVVKPGDQLHISLAYEGAMGVGPGRHAWLEPEAGWYPSHRDITEMTYRVELDLPDDYRLEGPAARNRKSWDWGSVKPHPCISVPAIIKKGDHK